MSTDFLAKEWNGSECGRAAATQGHLVRGRAACLLGFLALFAALLAYRVAHYDADHLRQTDLSVARFHQCLTIGQADAIYDDLTAEFQRKITREGNRQFLRYLRQQFGPVRSCHRTQAKVEPRWSATFTTAQYRTEFAQGAAIETFTWELRSRRARLLAYNISSPVIAD